MVEEVCDDGLEDSEDADDSEESEDDAVGVTTGLTGVFELCAELDAGTDEDCADDDGSSRNDAADDEAGTSVLSLEEDGGHSIGGHGSNEKLLDACGSPGIDSTELDACCSLVPPGTCVNPT